MLPWVRASGRFVQLNQLNLRHDMTVPLLVDTVVDMADNITLISNLQQMTVQVTSAYILIYCGRL